MERGHEPAFERSAGRSAAIAAGLLLLNRKKTGKQHTAPASAVDLVLYVVFFLPGRSHVLSGGRHVIQIGSQGTPEPIDVRCGGELQLQ